MDEFIEIIKIIKKHKEIQKKVKHFAELVIKECPWDKEMAEDTMKLINLDAKNLLKTVADVEEMITFLEPVKN